MKSIIIFGATGMVGQGLLYESLLDPLIEKITVVGRTPLRQKFSKVHEILHTKLFNYDDIREQLKGIDACFFCLGTSSLGKSEAEYKKITKDLTLTVAQTLLELNSGLTFIYVSAEGADSSESSRSMWARVRGQTENELLRLFKKIFIFRPGIIQPLKGIQSKTLLYRLSYHLLKPVLPVFRYLFPRHITSTELLARAMLKVAREGYNKRILKSADFYELHVGS